MPKESLAPNIIDKYTLLQTNHESEVKEYQPHPFVSHTFST